MLVYTIQSCDLDITAKVYADKTRCRLPEARPVYEKLFKDYNQKFRTNYEAFFWGFSNLRNSQTDEEIIMDIMAKVGTNEGTFLVLDVPDEICMETNFYNFSDEIFAFEYPEELESLWDTVYNIGPKDDTQVIFPYIKPEFIKRTKKLTK